MLILLSPSHHCFPLALNNSGSQAPPPTRKRLNDFQLVKEGSFERAAYDTLKRRRLVKANRKMIKNIEARRGELGASYDVQKGFWDPLPPAVENNACFPATKKLKVSSLFNDISKSRTAESRVDLATVDTWKDKTLIDAHHKLCCDTPSSFLLGSAHQSKFDFPNDTDTVEAKAEATSINTDVKKNTNSTSKSFSFEPKRLADKLFPEVTLTFKVRTYDHTAISLKRIIPF